MSSTNTVETFMIKTVQKRDGSLVNFDVERITNAIYKAMQVSDEGSMQEAVRIAKHVTSELAEIKQRYKTFTPNVEGIQNALSNLQLFLFLIY